MFTDWSAARTAVSEAGVVTMVVLRRLLGATRSATRTVWRLLTWLVHGLRSLATVAFSRVAAVRSVAAERDVVGAVRVGLLGKRSDVSVVLTLLSPGLALLAAWWVESTVGYETLPTWVRGTWFGTDPSPMIFLAVGGLLALGVISAGVNSGLLPTGLLVSAPIFGASVTRYGTTVTYTWGSQVVSLPNAVGMAIIFALGFGVPITISGFVLGRALRRVVRVLGGGAGPSAPDDTA